MNNDNINASRLASDIIDKVVKHLPLENDESISDWIKSLHVSMIKEVKEREEALSLKLSSEDYTEAYYSLGENFDCLPPMIYDLEVEKGTITEQIKKYNNDKFKGVVRQNSRHILGPISVLSFLSGKRLYRAIFITKKIEAEYKLTPANYTEMVNGFDRRLLELNDEIKKLKVKLSTNTKKTDKSNRKKTELDLLKMTITSFTKKRVSLSNYLQ